MHVPDQPIQGQSKRPKQPVLKPLWQRIADRANAIPDEELAKIQHGHTCCMSGHSTIRSSL